MSHACNDILRPGDMLVFVSPKGYEAKGPLVFLGLHSRTPNNDVWWRVFDVGRCEVVILVIWPQDEWEVKAPFDQCVDVPVEQ